MENSKLQGDATADKCAKYGCFLNLNEKMEMTPQFPISTPNQGQSINLVTRRMRSLNFKFSIFP